MVIVVNVGLEAFVAPARIEVVCEHLVVCLVDGPTVVGHPINRDHGARSVPPASAVNVDDTVGRIVDIFEKFNCLRVGRSAVTVNSNVDVFDTGCLGVALCAAFRVAA